MSLTYKTRSHQPMISAEQPGASTSFVVAMQTPHHMGKGITLTAPKPKQIFEKNINLETKRKKTCLHISYRYPTETIIHCNIILK